MGRRAYIDTSIIRDDLRARPDGQAHNEHSQSCHNTEPIGMDGRLDWFRWNCWHCDRKHINRRGEKRTKYYRCWGCDKLHHMNSGFFTLAERRSWGKKTVPLRPDEVDGVLCRVELDYEPSSYADPEWHYGVEEVLEDKIAGDWEVVTPIEVVEQPVEAAP